MLDGMAPGQRVGLAYHVMSDLFPPGPEDSVGREACDAYIKSHLCHIEDVVAKRTVWVIKDS